MGIFSSLEAVGRGSETQLRMSENLNKHTLSGKGVTIILLFYIEDNRTPTSFPLG